MRVFAFLSLLLSGSISMGQSVVVGNAGEGIMADDGKVYLRDLFDNQLHLNPYMGKFVHAEFEDRLDNSGSLVALRIDKGILAKKLTDLDTSFPGLGLYITAAIQYHEWRLVDEELNPFPDGGSPLQTKNQRVPLANRFLSTIRIQRQHWEKMDENNKVALIIHETLASFQRLNCTNGLCVNDNHRLRDLVAYVFSPRLGKNARLNERFRMEFKLPDWPYPSSQPLPAGVIKIDPRYNSVFYSERSIAYLTISLCLRPSFPKTFELLVRRDPFYLIERSFLASYDGSQPYTLINLHIKPVESYIRVKGTFEIFGNSRTKCLTYFENILSQWLKYEPFPRTNKRD